MKIKNSKLKNQNYTQRTFENGQSLFELVVAIAISALVIVAIVSLVTNSIRSAVFAKNQSTASDLADKTIEWLRGQRDQDIQGFLNYVDPTLGGSPVYCFKDLNLNWNYGVLCNSDGGDAIEGTLFTRQATFRVYDDPVKAKTIIEAEIDVSWKDSQGEHKVVNTTNFTDWRQR